MPEDLLDEGTPKRWLVVSVEREAREGADRLAQNGWDALVAAEIVAVLLGAGGRGVVEEKGRWLTHLPEPGDVPAVVDALRRSLDAAVPGHGARISTEWQEHQEWESLWREGLGPRRLTERMVVTPSWCRPEAGPRDLVIVVDPGMAFGTAEHETTRGCLRLLDGTVQQGDRVLDVGTGSGILAVGAALLGAREVEALDDDPFAVEAALETVRVNRLDARIAVRQARATAPGIAKGVARDGITANIQSSVLVDLLPGFHEALREGGWLIVSGIELHERDDFMREAARAGFTLEREDAEGRWWSARLRPSSDHGSE